MDWSCFRMFNKVEEKKTSPLKVILIVIGAIVAVGAAVAVVYTIFKKYFTVTFECDGDCECCDEDCLMDEEDLESDPICLEEEEEVAAPEADEAVTE
ncbi:MAG: hypothetical protein E7662_05745 [Ruminococcaceae bacterium]|nr:hypothetical protein [Oscillospiraceae bacterium]